MHGDGLSVWQLPSGKWTGQLTIRQIDGSRRKFQRRRDTRADALEAVKELQQQLSKPEAERPKKLGELLPGFLSFKRSTVRPNTVADYKHQLELWVLPRIGEIQASALRPRAERIWSFRGYGQHRSDAVVISNDLCGHGGPSFAQPMQFCWQFSLRWQQPRPSALEPGGSFKSLECLPWNSNRAFHDSGDPIGKQTRRVVGPQVGRHRFSKCRNTN